MALGIALEDILIKAPTEAAAFAAGLAIHPTLAPLLQDLSNFTWSEHPDKRLDLTLAAEVAAEDVGTYSAMEQEVSYTGYDATRFKWAYGVSLNAPGTGELLAMLRRATIDAGDFTHGLRKARLETRWDSGLADLQHERLTPQQIALGIVRSVVPDPGLLAVTLDTAGGVVPAYQPWAGDVTAEAKAGGYDLERLRVLVGEIGLPMSAQQAASAYFRNIIHQADFNRAILEGDTRPEWAPFILEQARQIPSAVDGVQWHLRGWTDAAGMYAQTGRHGMSQADTDLLFQIHGRPLSWHQIFIGLRRGGVYNGPTTNIDPAFLKGLRESDIRPEWYDLAWAQRYTYPTAFVLRSLTESGDISEAEAERILLYEGWEPQLAATVAGKWAAAAKAGTGAAKPDPWVTKAHNHLWTAVQKGYIGGSVDQPNATQSFGVIGIDPAVHPAIFQAWDEQRRIEAL